MTRILSLLLLTMCVTMAFGQRTTRKSLKTVNHKNARTELVCLYDTIKGTALPLKITGYEKPLRATRETMLITNNDSCRCLNSVELEIEYNDMKGRQLHKRVVTLQAEIPAGETRLLETKSWDKNNLFYYHVNIPGRTNAQATPYKVQIIPLEGVFYKRAE